jgi:hypothetical protein
MSRKGERNAQLRKKHIPTVKAFCDDLGIEWHYVHDFEWHIRIGGVMDIFPTRNRYHLLKTEERGSFSDYEELGQIFERYVNSEQFGW